MSNLGNVSLMPNPFYSGDEGVESEVKFYSKIFCISKHPSSDNAAYEALMESLYPFDPDSSLQINPFANGNGVSKTWTKEGDLLIQVEYIEIVPKEATQIKADNIGEVKQILSGGNGTFIIKIGDFDYKVPQGMTIKVKAGDQIREGQILASSDTPKSDSRDY